MAVPLNSTLEPLVSVTLLGVDVAPRRTAPKSRETGLTETSTVTPTPRTDTVRVRVQAGVAGSETVNVRVPLKTPDDGGAKVIWTSPAAET